MSGDAFAHLIAAGVFLLFAVTIIQRDHKATAAMAPLVTLAAGYVFGNILTKGRK